MTTFAGGVWKTLATLAYQTHWMRRMGNGAHPTLGIIDHRADLSTVYDPLVRVADFLAATSARWQLDINRLSRPRGAKEDAGIRYRWVLRGWFAENELLWLGRLYLPNGSMQAARVAISRSRQ
jgi:hypothetical protein